MRSLCVVGFTLFLLAAVSPAQQASTTAVPNLINYSGTLALSSGLGVPARTVGVTFAIYRQQDGGAPVWMETQNVTPDSTGHYTVLLGSTKAEGIPADLFSTQEQRWLGVRMQGEAEQPRVLLVSVPYAMKAADAETIGGMPPSAFVLASPSNSTSAGAAGATAAHGLVTGTTPQLLAPGPRPIITGSGKVNQLAKFDANTDITNSIIFDNGTSVGIGTTSPTAKLGVNGSVSAAGFNIGSNPFAYGSFAKSNAFLGFAGNTTMTGLGNTASGYQALIANTTGSWNAACGEGALFSNTTGSLNAANGASALALNTTGYQNTASGYAALSSNTTGYRNTASGGNALQSNTSGSSNTATGFLALFANTIGGGNTAAGGSALTSNTTGSSNMATGFFALLTNTTGSGNTAAGGNALSSNTSGSYNTATGVFALANNTTGILNTAIGENAGPDRNSPNLTNATAIGANAIVSENNALVLGGTGSNAVSVGIGTPTPAYTLDVQGSGRFTQPIIFASNQTFPGVAQLNVGNTFTGNQTVNGNLLATGFVTSFTGVVGAALFDDGIGVIGDTNGSPGIGVFGYGHTPSTTEERYFNRVRVGVWGDIGPNANHPQGTGVLATADDNSAVVAINNSGNDQNGPFTAVVEDLSNSFNVFQVQGPNGNCRFDSSGNVFCTGAKSAVVPVEGGQKTVALYAVEAPENWFEDFGSGQLTNGVATVALEGTYAQTVNTNIEYHVFLTPRGDCNGLYVSNETPASFEVHELQGGHSSIAFDYRIIAKRRGYEQIRMADMTTITKQAAMQTARFTTSMGPK